MSDVGKAICDSVAFVSSVGAECERLSKLIKQELSELLLDSDLVGRYRAGGDWAESYDHDAHGWVYTALALSLPVIVKPKRSVSAYLVVQISLAGIGVAATDNHEPLLHIGWWNAPIDFEEVVMGFPLDSNETQRISLEHNRLFRWTHLDQQTEWLYSLRLTSLNSPSDVWTSIIEPVKALLLSAGAAEALPESISGVVMYVNLEAQEGQYRVLRS